ncbi:MAG: AgmX/PglI C-terminal domain-containing protein [Bdellovibrionota bacterium]
MGSQEIRNQMAGNVKPGNIMRNIARFTHEDGRCYLFEKEKIVVGSIVSADIRLGGDGVAPIHSLIEICGSGVVIYDLASESGVFVNGSKVVTSPLNDGDKITIGHHNLVYGTGALESTPGKGYVKQEKSEGHGGLILEESDVFESIMDYRPSSQDMKDTLEVIMSWNETVINVGHFVKSKAISLGSTKKNDFHIPPVLSEAEHKLIVRSGDGYVLNLDPKMSVVLQQKGQLSRFDSQPAGSGQNTQIAFGKDDFAKITIRDLVFFISNSVAPPRLKRNRLFERDPLFLKVFFSSLAMTAAVIMALLNAEVPQTLEAEQLPERIATILYQPERFVTKRQVVTAAKTADTDIKPVETKTEPTPPKPKETVKIDIQPNPANALKPVPKTIDVKQNSTKGKGAISKKAGSSVAQSEAKEGEGARAKGKEGRRGSKNAPTVAKQKPQNAAFRPSPQGGAGRGSGSSQVPNEGNVDFLKGTGGKIANLLANSAAKLGKGGEKLKGFGGFTTEGSGGLALSGAGSGGGGDAASLGGIGEKGRGGGRVGTGLGAAGSGAGIIGGQTRVVIRAGGPEETVVMGNIDADAIEAALLAHRDEFRLCYERELNAENPKLAGRVGTSFVIGSSGRVNQAGIESTTLKNVNAEGCIIQVIKRIQFPIPRGAGIVQVTYPFKFNVVGGG